MPKCRALGLQLLFRTALHAFEHPTTFGGRGHGQRTSDLTLLSLTLLLQLEMTRFDETL